MASTPVIFDAPSGMTLTLKLYPFGSDVIANGAGGDAATERTNNKGTYQATVTEAITGWHHATIEDASGNVIAKYAVWLEDNTSEHYCQDPFTVPPGSNGGLPTVDANNYVAGIQGTKNTLDALNDLAQSDILSDATPFAGALVSQLDPTVAGTAAAEIDRMLSVVLTGLTTQNETDAGKHSLAALVMIHTNASVSGTTLTAKKPSDDSTFQTYTVTTDSAANPITGIS